MLALVVTVTLALYVFGPDAFSRFILDFSVPRRSVTLTRSEEVYRAILWSGGSLALGYLWARRFGPLSRLWSWPDLQTFFSGIYSEEFFRKNGDLWFRSLHSVIWMNLIILWRVYFIILMMSLAIIVMIRFYSHIRDWLDGPFCLKRWFRKAFAALVLPRVAPWHLLLSDILMRNKKVQLHVDAMTKMDVLYQGRLADKMLAADGGLLGITLAEPKRFLRAEYLEAKKRPEGANKADFWKPIPTNLFIIMASEIHTMNLRYVPEDVGAMKRKRDGDDFEKELDAVNALVLELLKDVSQRGSAGA